MVREHAGVIDLTPAGKFHITGPDTQQLLNYAYCNVLPQVRGYPLQETVWSNRALSIFTMSVMLLFLQILQPSCTPRLTTSVYIKDER